VSRIKGEEDTKKPKKKGASKQKKEVRNVLGYTELKENQNAKEGKNGERSGYLKVCKKRRRNQQKGPLAKERGTKKEKDEN